MTINGVMTADARYLCGSWTFLMAAQLDAKFA